MLLRSPRRLFGNFVEPSRLEEGEVVTRFPLIVSSPADKRASEKLLSPSGVLRRDTVKLPGTLVRLVVPLCGRKRTTALR